MSESRPNRQQILDMMNGFRPACVIGAAAELDVWTALGGQSLLAEQLAKKLHTDLRATTILLDAVAALGLLDSAICHQHSRQHNRELFAKVFRALAPGGRIAVRDVVMEPNRIGPREGALFAVNMLVNTDSGDTFTFDEYAEDLRSAGFENPQLQVKHEAMNSVVVAEKP